jgi:hypothetical protein
MSRPANQDRAEPVARVRCAGLAAVLILGTAGLAAACGGQREEKVGESRTPTGLSAPQSGSTASREMGVIDFVNCMRTHGEPHMPVPAIEGTSLHITAIRGSGFNPKSPQFTAASNACKPLLIGPTTTSG